MHNHALPTGAFCLDGGQLRLVAVRPQVLLVAVWLVLAPCPSYLVREAHPVPLYLGFVLVDVALDGRLLVEVASWLLPPLGRSPVVAGEDIAVANLVRVALLAAVAAVVGRGGIHCVLIHFVAPLLEGAQRRSALLRRVILKTAAALAAAALAAIA